MIAQFLRTEYLNNPIGIDIEKPRFFWKCFGGKRQTAYRILAQFSDETIAWDSGKVESSHMTHIPYEGVPLKSRERVYWQVKLWDENGVEGDWSKEAFFEMGLLNHEDWKAKWITAPYKPNREERYPADYFLKNVTLENDIKDARLYITACGLYKAYINDMPVTSDCLTPGCTQYEKHLQYQVYDVKDLLTHGDNTLMTIVGDGWYRGNIGAYSKNYVYGTQTKLLFQLEITYTNGDSDVIISDGSFLWSNSGPIRENDLKDGEVYDANSKPQFNQQAVLTDYRTELVCSNNVPVRERDRFSPSVIKTPNGHTVLDFGQNIAGYIEFKAPVKKGHTITLKLGEMLDRDGNFTQRTLQMGDNPETYCKQEITFICSEQAVLYKPRFTVMGFRYVQIENWPGEVNPNDFHSIAVYSAMDETSRFDCGNELVNKLVSNTLWGMKSNFLEIPTDCPGRERAGWTGDAQVFFETGATLMNCATFFRKWLRDVVDRQLEDGRITNVAPGVGEDDMLALIDGSVGWADAIVLIPYRYYKLFGDLEILSTFYPAMKRYAQYMIKSANNKDLGFNPEDQDQMAYMNNIPRDLELESLLKENPYGKYTYESGAHWGEWAEPRGEYDNFQSMLNPALRIEIATSYLHYTMNYMTEIAELLNKPEDKELFTEYAEGAKKAYNFLFVKNNDIETDRSGRLVRPLEMDLLGNEAKQNIARRLVEVVRKRDYKIGTGFLSTPFILSVLTDNGYVEDAYKMLQQKQAPGWIYQIEQGATTIWEHWDIYQPDGTIDGSLNHYAFGSVCYWLFSHVCGITYSDTPGHFIIEPRPSKQLGHANASWDSVWGEVKSGWEFVGDKVEFIISIPPNTEATIKLPDGRQMVKGTGEYRYEM